MEEEFRRHGICEKMDTAPVECHWGGVFLDDPRGMGDPQKPLLAMTPLRDLNIITNN